MIVGARYWNDRTRYSVQTNNPTEERLRKEGVGGWLETCGPTAAVNCLDALGARMEVVCPGGFKPQPEEVLADWFEDPRNYPAIKKARPELDPWKWQGNRIPQAYPAAVADVFGAKAVFSFEASRSVVVAHLSAGRAVQLCLEKPGHFLAAVAYDPVTDEIIYHDSWPARVGGDGFCKRMKPAEFLANVKPFIIVYSLEEV